MDSIKYEEVLWGKIDLLHERYHKEYIHISHFLEIMTKFQMACFDFSKTLKNILNKKLVIADSDSSTLNKSMENFIKCLSVHSQVFNETNESIKSTIIEPITKAINENFQREKDLYNTYSRLRTTYNNSKSSLEKNHKEYLSRAKECETLVYNAKKSKMYSLAPAEQILKMEAKASDYLANTVLCEDRYITSLNEANKARENETNFQKKLQNYYYKSDNDFYTKIKKITGFFITSLKKMYTSISIEIDSLADKFTRIDVETDIHEFIEQNKSKDRPDNPIRFCPYKPAAEAINNTKITSKRRDSTDLNVSLEVIKTFQKLFKNIRTDLNMDEEAKKNRVRILSEQLFKIGNNNKFTKKEKTELFSNLKEQNSRTYFFKFISKLKEKGFKNDETSLKGLKEIFEHILELSENEKDFESAQNCIILSQSIFNEDNSKKKKYLIDYIRNNQWFSNIEFWEGMIDSMIQKEITKDDELNKNKNEEERKSNIKNIVFSQVFSYSNNMVDFNIKKEDIISLVKKFSSKYEIEKEMEDSIIENINNIEKNKIDEENKENKIEEEKEKIKEEQKEEEEENNEINKPKKIEVIKDYFGSSSNKEDIKGENEEKNKNDDNKDNE